MTALPPLWKREIQKAVKEGADRSSDERNRKHEEDRTAIAAPLHNLVQEFKAYQEKQGRTDEESSVRERATLAALIATVVFTALTFVVFHSQLDEMRKVYGPIKDQADATRESYAAVQRPFLVARTAEAYQRNLLWNFQVVFENNGVTPPKHPIVTVIPSFDLSEVNLPPAPNRKTPLYAPADPAEWQPGPPGYTTIVDLKRKTPYPLDVIGLPGNFVAQMAENRADGYISGTIRYGAFFQKSKDHFAKFCFVLVPIKNGDGTIAIAVSLCRHWNCEDDECETDKAEYNVEMVALRSRR
jgi:hypothetical protein